MTICLFIKYIYRFAKIHEQTSLQRKIFLIFMIINNNTYVSYLFSTRRMVFINLEKISPNTII